MAKTGRIDRMKQVWAQHSRVGHTGAAEVPVDFVAELGRVARVIDVRERVDISGLHGHVPGSAWCAFDALAEIPKKLGKDAFVILVSNRGDRAAKGAAYLTALGMPYAAAMTGGMIAWRNAGYSASRTDRPLTRTLEQMMPTPDPLGPISRDRIERHVGHPTNTRWVKLSALLVNGKRSCVDGRDEQGVIGTPGGDAGELLLALAALEEVTGHKLSPTAVEGALRSELDTFGSFYLHTDTQAFHQLTEAIKKDATLAAPVSALESDTDWHAFLDAPPRELWPKLLEQLTEPAHVGCGHIRLSMLHPDEYGTRAELVKSFLVAFHKLRWSGSPDLELVTLAGTHEEVAVLNVYADTELWDFAPIPLVSPAVGASQVFINHPQVAERHREHYVQFFKRLPPLSQTPDKVEAFGKALHALANKQLGRTLHYLAKGLPIYSAHYLGEDKVRVEEVGKVS